ncbi:MAG: glycosyltransferase family 2 protein [Bacteroidaceae bacterium]|nr:glycosyltransferase family 2 protein [Bacteroidaceae bacterium]
MVLALVLPCYNEEAVLPTSFERLTVLFDTLTAEGCISADSFMTFVNDGSCDRTWELIKEQSARDHRFRGISLARNSGHQNAILSGMMAVRGECDAVITIDADLQDDLAAIRTMVEHFEKGSDIVYGVKVSRKADPLLKRISAQSFYKMQSAMGVNAVYNHADFRLMSRRAVDMLADYPERNIYLRGIVPTLGLRQTTVDDVISERTAGESKYNLVRMLTLATNGITAFSTRPIQLILMMGGVFLFLGLLMAVYILGSFFSGHTTTGWTSIMMSIWIIGGAIMLSLGMVGVYIGKIYTEVKRRPLYHIAESVGFNA